MGLDLALGAFVFLAAMRGWSRGFVRQAIGLSALVGCVYLADPVRDLARPYAQGYLPGVRPELLERLLWWIAAVTSFVVTAGIATIILHASRRRPYGITGPNRTDQGAGLVLGATKGAIVGVFLAAGIASYAPSYIHPAGWFTDQMRTSRALVISEQYKPAQWIWTSSPVQTLVARVRSRGLWSEPAGEPNKVPSTTTDSSAAAAPVQTARRPTSMELPKRPSLNPFEPDFLRRLDEAIRAEGLDNSR